MKIEVVKEVSQIFVHFNKRSANELMIHTKVWEIYLTFVRIILVGFMVERCITKRNVPPRTL